MARNRTQIVKGIWAVARGKLGWDEEDVRTALRFHTVGRTNAMRECSDKELALFLAKLEGHKADERAAREAHECTDKQWRALHAQMKRLGWTDLTTLAAYVRTRNILSGTLKGPHEWNAKEAYKVIATLDKFIDRNEQLGIERGQA